MKELESLLFLDNQFCYVAIIYKKDTACQRRWKKVGFFGSPEDFDGILDSELSALISSTINF